MPEKNDGLRRLLLSSVLASTILKLGVRGECADSDFRAIAIIDYGINGTLPAELKPFLTSDDERWIDDPTFAPDYSPYK